MRREDEPFFRPRKSDVRIPLETKGYPFKFTRRWFIQRNLTTWSTYLQPRFGSGQRVRMLQIGVFEGMDLVWCCQNLLRHPDSSAVAVDPWLPTTKLSADYMKEVEAHARHNLCAYENKVRIVKGRSEDELPLMDGAFDLIVIDGDHNAPAVYCDAVQALRLLVPGGWMVFDDVRNRIPKREHVQDGLDMFLKVYGDKVTREWQHRFVDTYSKRRR